MKYRIRRAEVRDAKLVHDFEIALQKEMHDLYKTSKLKEFAKTELRNSKIYTTKDYKKWLSKNKLNKIWYVLEIAVSGKPKIIGDIYAEIKENKGMQISKNGYIDSLYMLKKYRGKGYARKLINKILEWFKTKKVKYVSLNVDLINEPAKSIYRKAGFKHCKNEMRLKL